MRIITVIFAVVALCTANQTETKEKRQIHYTSVPTQLKQLSHGYQHGHQHQQQQQASQHQHYRASSEQQQPASAQVGGSGEEIPAEYYNAIKEFAEKQAELIQRQQLEVGMKDLIQRVGGRVEIKNYEIPYDPKNPTAIKLPQSSSGEAPIEYGKEQEPLIIERPVEYVRVQPGHPGHPGHPGQQSSESSGESHQPHYARLSSPPQHQPVKYGFAPQEQQASYENAGQQQAQYVSVPQGHHYSSITGHPLASSTLEKEIAKLESSFQSQFKAQSQQPHQHHLSSQQPQALRFKAQPHQHQFQLNQNQFAYVAPGAAKYQSHVQPTPLTVGEDGQFISSTGHSEAATAGGKNQYISEVHRFYNQAPKPISSQQQQAHFYGAQQQQQPNKIQFVSTEKPVEEVQQDSTPKYDTLNTMKIIPAPQLQYERPAKYQPQQPQAAAYYSNYKVKSAGQLQESAGPDANSLNIFKAAVSGAEVAPSRSSIFVSQSTGAPQVQYKPQQQSQLAQQYQYPNFHRQSVHQQLQKQQQQQQQQQHQQQQHQSQQGHHQVRLPPPNGGRPLTQDEFQALVDAGYSVTAIPVPVPVPAEQYHKQQQQKQRYQSSQQHPIPDVSYDVSDEARSNNTPRLIKY